jgi:hypothetical protein
MPIDTEVMSRPDYAKSLVRQLQGMDTMIKSVNERNGHPIKETLHGVVLNHGIGKFGSRLPAGLRKLTNRLCFSHAADLMLRNPRYVYCEGFAIRTSLGIVVGEHAWVLDRERDWMVIDNTWERPIEGIYLGIPFTHDFVIRCMMGRDAEGNEIGNRVYGVLDRYDLKWPVLREPPENWLHQDADQIPRDFEVIHE